MKPNVEVMVTVLEQFLEEDKIIEKLAQKEQVCHTELWWSWCEQRNFLDKDSWLTPRKGK